MTRWGNMELAQPILRDDEFDLSNKKIVIMGKLDS